MATENPRVWFKSISLENVRSFGTKQTINFTDKDGNIARWNVILGDNGTGKTTVLNSLLMGEPDFENHPKLGQAFRSKALPIHITSNRERSHINGNNDAIISEVIFKWTKKSEVKRQFINSTNVLEYWHMLVAYPATRFISESTLPKQNDSLYEIFIDGREELTNAEEWLIQSDYLSLKAAYYKDRFNLVRNILLKLFHTQVEDIFINIEAGVPKVFFKTYYGNVRLHELSLGYKTLIAWMVDFAKGLLDWHPDSKDPLSEPAVCLVDELDLHLHPKFQRTIIQFLTETFPNTQFIVTAHSPLIVQAAEEYNVNLILLKREGDETVVVNDPVDVRNWRLDQILSSELFNVEDPATKLRRERDQLLAKKKLTEEEQNRLQKLNADLDAVPFSSDPVEVKAETIIHQLAEALRSRMQPHDTN